MALSRPASDYQAMKRSQIYLKAWRKLRGLTQEQLAGRLDTTAATISRWETGKAPWDINDLNGIAYALQCDAVDLFRDPASPEGKAWRIIKGMKPDAKERATRILEALAAEDTPAA